MALGPNATIAFCSQCRAPVKPHPFDPSYSDSGKCVLCNEPEEHPVHRV